MSVFNPEHRHRRMVTVDETVEKVSKSNGSVETDTKSHSLNNREREILSLNVEGVTIVCFPLKFVPSNIAMSTLSTLIFLKASSSC